MKAQIALQALFVFGAQLRQTLVQRLAIEIADAHIGVVHPLHELQLPMAGHVVGDLVGGVEQAPGRQRVRRCRLQQVRHQRRARLVDGHKQRAARDVHHGRHPLTLDERAQTPLVALGVEANLGRIDAHLLGGPLGARLLNGAIGDAMLIQKWTHTGRPSGGNHIAATRQRHRGFLHRLDVLVQRYVPGFGTVQVVGDEAPTDHRRVCVHRVGIALHPQTARWQRNAQLQCVAPVQVHRLAAQVDAATVGLPGQLQPGLSVLGRQFEHADDDVLTGPHAAGVVVPSMVLHQHAHAVAQHGIDVREARRIGIDHHPRSRVLQIHQHRGEVQWSMAFGPDALDGACVQVLGGQPQLGIEAEHGRHRQRHVVAIAHAIGDVQVQRQQRIPRMDQCQHVPHLRGLRQHPVAVEVHALCRHALSLQARPILVGTVVRSGPLVAVDVEDGHEHQRLVLQQIRPRRPIEPIAQQQQARILAIDLAGVAAADQQHHGGLGQPRLCGGQGTRAAHHQRVHAAPFGGGAKALAAHPLRMALLQGSALAFDLGVIARVFKGGGLCAQGRQIRCGGLGESEPQAQTPQTQGSRYGMEA